MKYCKNFNKINIILIPENASRVKQFRLPFSLIPIFGLFLLSIGAFISWFNVDYQERKTQMRRLVHLKKDNEQQKTQLFFLAQRINQINQKMEEFKGIHYELKALVNLENSDDNTNFPDIGDSEPGFLKTDHRIKENQQGLVRLIHGTLDDLNDRIDTQKREMFDLGKSMKNQKALIISKLSKPYPWAKEGRLNLPAQKSKRRMKILEYSRKELVEIEETTPFGNGKGQIEKGADHAKNGVDKEEKIRNQIKTIAIELGLEPGLALSMAKVESGYDPKKVSPKGAVGVLQVMPKLAKHDFGITREMLFDPQINIIIGLSWMKSLLKRFGQNLDLSLAAYNAGASRVVKAGYRVPRIKETQAYVRKVKEHMENEVSWPVEKI
jgi:hypothetical protein